MYLHSWYWTDGYRTETVLSQEFSLAFAVIVYIPPSAAGVSTSDVIHVVIAGLQTQHPSALIMINGILNHVSLCNKRQNKILDLLFIIVRGAYSSSSLHPFGESDHDLIQLLSWTYSSIGPTQPLPLWAQTVRLGPHPSSLPPFRPLLDTPYSSPSWTWLPPPPLSVNSKLQRTTSPHPPWPSIPIILKIQKPVHPLLTILTLRTTITTTQGTKGALRAPNQ